MYLDKEYIVVADHFLAEFAVSIATAAGGGCCGGSATSIFTAAVTFIFSCECFCIIFEVKDKCHAFVFRVPFTDLQLSPQIWAHNNKLPIRIVNCFKPTEPSREFLSVLL